MANNLLDKLPDYIVLAYLTNATYAVDALEQESNHQLNDPYGWEENQGIVTESELYFIPIHYLLMAETHSREIQPIAEDFFTYLVERGNSIFKERWGKARTIDEIVNLVNYQAQLELLSQKTARGKSKLYDALLMISSRLSSTRV